jgi:hypothetical protein
LPFAKAREGDCQLAQFDGEMIPIVYVIAALGRLLETYLSRCHRAGACC